MNGLIKRALEVIVVSEGKETVLSPGAQNALYSVMDGVCDGGYEMPAFGVALNDFVTEALGKGLWLKFVFSGVETHNGMDFEALLVGLNYGSGGLEFMRFLNGQYGGRDFHFALKRGANADALVSFAAEAAGEK